MKAYTRLIQTSDKESLLDECWLIPPFVRALNSRLSHSFIQSKRRADRAHDSRSSYTHSLAIRSIPCFHARRSHTRARAKEDEAGGGIRASEPPRAWENGSRFRQGCIPNTDRKMANFYRYNADIRLQCYRCYFSTPSYRARVETFVNKVMVTKKKRKGKERACCSPRNPLGKLSSLLSTSCVCQHASDLI